MSYGASQGGGFLSQSGSQGDSGSKAKVNSLRPVTIYQVLNAGHPHADAEFTIDDQQVKDVTIVACVRNKIKNTTNMSFVMEDGTGQIDCRMWVNAEGPEDLYDEIDVNVYVRVTGPLKSFGGKTHIAINSLSAVEDHNEILFHAVEVVYTHLRITKGDPIANGGGGGHAAGGQTGANNPYAAKASTTADKDDSGEYSTLPLLQRKIMEFVAGLGDETPEEGVHIREIHRQAGGTVPFERFETEITQLIDDGQLYTTIDDDHLLTTK